jgi:hypothetical protein
MLAFGAPADSTEVTAPQMIDAFEGDFGVHPGQRRNHTKGLCAAGEFVGTSDAAALSRSALFSGKTIPVVARFSLGGGDPEAPDAAPPRGVGLEFHLPAARCSTSLHRRRYSPQRHRPPSAISSWPRSLIPRRVGPTPRS